MRSHYRCRDASINTHTIQYIPQAVTTLAARYSTFLLTHKMVTNAISSTVTRKIFVARNFQEFQENSWKIHISPCLFSWTWCYPSDNSNRTLNFALVIFAHYSNPQKSRNQNTHENFPGYSSLQSYRNEAPQHSTGLQQHSKQDISTSPNLPPQRECSPKAKWPKALDSPTCTPSAPPHPQNSTCCSSEKQDPLQPPPQEWAESSTNHTHLSGNKSPN